MLSASQGRAEGKEAGIEVKMGLNVRFVAGKPNLNPNSKPNLTGTKPKPKPVSSVPQTTRIGSRILP